MKPLAALLLGLAWVPLAQGQEHLAHGRFKDVVVYRPDGATKQVVLFLSGDGGWSGGVAEIAEALAERGATVVGIDVPQFFAALGADGGSCVFPDGDLENLSHYVQAYEKLPSYYTPLFAGYSSGATLAYAMLAQAPQGTFAGALSLGFRPELALAKPLCSGEGLHFAAEQDGRGVTLLPDAGLRTPWVVLQGEQDQVCGVQTARTFVSAVPSASVVVLPKVGHGFSVSDHWLPQFLAAYDGLVAERTSSIPAPPASLADLPVVEVPAASDGNTFAVMLSGDGGWAGLDAGVAAALAARGVPVAGLDSLRYFWTARTPDGLAGDLDRLLRYYAARWNKPRAILIGYSQGADVLPFAINRLPAASKALVRENVLMGLSEKASFEFHLANWLPGHGGEVPIQPEAEKLSAASTLCLYGMAEDDSLCPKIGAGHVTARALPGGHHFDGAYDEIAALILESAGVR